MKMRYFVTQEDGALTFEEVRMRNRRDGLRMREDFLLEDACFRLSRRRKRRKRRRRNKRRK